MPEWIKPGDISDDHEKLNDAFNQASKIVNTRNATMISDHYDVTLESALSHGAEVTEIVKDFIQRAAAGGEVEASAMHTTLYAMGIYTGIEFERRRRDGSA